MVQKKRLNLVAIESSLIAAQQHFDQINARLTVRRKPPTDHVLANLMAGYEQIDRYLVAEIDLFKMGNSHLLLELNHLVLYQNTSQSMPESERQFKATQQYFYDANGGNIGGLMEWVALNTHRVVWKRAAGIFTYMLSQPQLFLEGNHRTGALIMSYMLMREGYAPFVLSTENAPHFFEPAELIKKRRKKTFDEFLHLPKQTRKFAHLLKREQSQQFWL